MNQRALQRDRGRPLHPREVISLMVQLLLEPDDDTWPSPASCAPSTTPPLAPGACCRWLMSTCAAPTPASSSASMARTTTTPPTPSARPTWSSRAPNAWIDHAKTKAGAEIPFIRHFYTYVPPRPLEEIDRDLNKVMLSKALPAMLYEYLKGQPVPQSS